MQKISMLQTADMVAKEIQPIRDMSTTFAWQQQPLGGACQSGEMLT